MISWVFHRENTILAPAEELVINGFPCGMAGQNEGDDSFSDSDLDDLPQNALDELENNAILHTQRFTQATQIIGAPQSPDYGDLFDDDDLDDAEVFDEAQILPGRLQPLYSRNGGSVMQQEVYRKTRYGDLNNVTPLIDRPLIQNSSIPIDSAKSLQRHAYPEGQRVASSVQGRPNSTIDELQKQVQELLRERDNLKQENTVKAGEIAIVRGMHEKAVKEYERKLTAEKNINAEKLAKQQQLIEEAKVAERGAVTELNFLQRELDEETAKLKSLQKAKEKERKDTIEQVATPKKHKSLAYRDGFDDDEIQIVSPSKFNARRSNPSTPTKAGAKRKRKGPDSPNIILEIEQEEPRPASPDLPGVLADEPFLEKFLQPDDRLDLLEIILDHRMRRDKLRTFEEFAKITFPSDPEASFASIILAKLPVLNSKQSASDFPIEFCKLILSLWRRCLDEKFYKPLHILMDLLRFNLELKTLAIAPFILDIVLPTAQETADLVSIPRFERTPHAHLAKDIDVSACLSIIHLVAMGCIHSKTSTIEFWHTMRLDFVLMMLSKQQAVEDFEMMLRLVSMSALKESIGPIPNDDSSQRDQASYIIERVSIMLINSPMAPEGSPKLENSAISNLHLQILRTLEAFCQTMWGGELVAINPQITNRLVKVMSNELDALYDYHSSHKQNARLLCLATRLLHYLITKHEKHINMQERLSKVYGGNQKYLLCLARLNFSTEDLILDADIDPEVAERAHQLLELAVTPEEGDAIHSAFSST